MNDEILNNIWQELTTDQLISSDFETWKTNIQDDEEAQGNIHDYLSDPNSGFVKRGGEPIKNSFEDWKINVLGEVPETTEKEQSIEDSYTYNKEDNTWIHNYNAPKIGENNEVVTSDDGNIVYEQIKDIVQEGDVPTEAKDIIFADLKKSVREGTSSEQTTAEYLFGVDDPGLSGNTIQENIEAFMPSTDEEKIASRTVYDSQKALEKLREDKKNFQLQVKKEAEAIKTNPLQDVGTQYLHGQMMVDPITGQSVPIANQQASNEAKEQEKIKNRLVGITSEGIDNDIKNNRYYKHEQDAIKIYDGLPSDVKNQIKDKKKYITDIAYKAMLEEEKQSIFDKNIENFIEDKQGILEFTKGDFAVDEVERSKEFKKQLEKKQKDNLDKLDIVKKSIEDVDNRINADVDVLSTINYNSYKTKLDEIDNEFKALGDVNENSPKEVIDKWNEINNRRNAIIKDYQADVVGNQKIYNNYLKNVEDRKRLYQTYQNTIQKDIQFNKDGKEVVNYINMMNRNGHNVTAAVNWVGTSAMSMANGIEGAVNAVKELPKDLLLEYYDNDKSKMPTLVKTLAVYDDVTDNMRSTGKDNFNKFIYDLNAGVQKPTEYGDIENLSDFGSFALNVGANFAPQLGLMAVTGGSSIYILGASAFGNKYDEMEGSNKLGYTDYSLAQKWAASGIVGGSEVLSESFTYGIFKAKYLGAPAYKRVQDGFTTRFLQTINPKYMVKSVPHSIGEGGSEVLAGIGGQAADRYVLGKNVSLWEGADANFVSGLIMERTMAMPGIYQKLSGPFYGGNYQAELAKNTKTQIETEKLLNKKDISVDLRSQLEDKLLNTIAKNEEIMAKNIENIDMMSNSEKQDLINIDVQIHKTKQEEDAINADESLSQQEKQNLIENLNIQEAELESQKNEIIEQYESPETRNEKVKVYEQQKQAVKEKIEKYNKRKITKFGATSEGELGSIKEFETAEEQQAFFNNRIAERNSYLQAEIEGYQEAIKDPDLLDSQKAVYENAMFTAKKEIEQNNKESKSNAGQFGFIASNGTGGFEIYVNKENSLAKGGRATTFGHEFLHGVLSKTIAADSETGMSLANALGGFITDKKGGFNRKFINRLMPYVEDANYGEEVLTVMSESIADGTLKFKENVFTKIGDIIRQNLQRYGLKNIKFNTGRDVYNFIKDYNTSLEKNYDSKAIDRLMDFGGEGKLVDGKVVKRDSFEKASKPAEAARDILNPIGKNMDTYDPNSSIISQQLPGMVKAQVNNYFNRRPKLTQNFDPEALKQAKEELGQDILFRLYNQTKEGKNDLNRFDGRGDLYGYLNGRIKYRMLDSFEQNPTIVPDFTQEQLNEERQKLEEQEDEATPAYELGREVEGDKVFLDIIGKKALQNEIRRDVVEIGVEGVDKYIDVKKNIVEHKKFTKDGIEITPELKAKRKEQNKKPLKELKSKRIPTGRFYPILEKIAKEYGVDPMRLIQEQDLDTKQRKTAQDLILSKHYEHIISIPEGTTKDGDPTGIANTKIGKAFFKAGGRMKFKTTGKGKGLKEQAKQRIEPSAYLELFGIVPKARVNDTSVDPAIRSQIIQSAVIATDQAIRQEKEALELTPEKIEKLKKGKGRLMFSKDGKQNNIGSITSSLTNEQDRIAFVESVPEFGVFFGSEEIYSLDKDAIKTALKEIYLDTPGIIKNIDNIADAIYFALEGKPLRKDPIMRTADIIDNIYRSNELAEKKLGSFFRVKEKFTSIQSSQKRVERKRANDKLYVLNRWEELNKKYKDDPDLAAALWYQEILMIKGHSATSGRIADKKFIQDPNNPIKVIKNPEYEKEQARRAQNNILVKKIKDKLKNPKLTKKEKNTLKERIAKLKKEGINPLKYGGQVWENVGDFNKNIIDSIKDENGKPAFKTKGKKVFYKGKDITNKVDFVIKSQTPAAVIKDSNSDIAMTDRENQIKQIRVNLNNYIEWYVNKWKNGSLDNTDLLMVGGNLLSNMNTMVATAAMPGWVTPDVRTTLEKLIYEHMQPRVGVLISIFDAHINSDGIKDINKHLSNYEVSIIPDQMDKVLKEAKVNEALAPDQTMEDPPWYRYYFDGTFGDKRMRHLIGIGKNKGKTAGEDFVKATKLIKPKIKEYKILDKAIMFSRSPREPRGITVLDFDDTLATTESLVKYTAPDGTTGTLNAEEYASTYQDLLEQGYKFDFSEFNKVVKGRLAPLFKKALKLQEKFGSENMFILTARPPAAQKPIYDFLKANGLNIPLKNITGLGNSTSEAKALWIADKVGEGYNDFYFADDALQNVQAVKNMLDQFDVKSKVQQAKLLEKHGRFLVDVSTKEGQEMVDRWKKIPTIRSSDPSRVTKFSKDPKKWVNLGETGYMKVDVSTKEGRDILKRFKNIPTISSSDPSRVTKGTILFSKPSDEVFNDILEDVAGIKSEKRFSAAKGRKRGEGKGRFRLFIPPSHEDFAGLLYNFMGKGEKGNKHRDFFEKTLIKPLNRAYRELNTAKQAIANDYRNLTKAMPDARKKLTKKTPDGDFTYGDAVRVYLWNKAGFDIPGMSKADVQNLSDLIKSDPILQSFADALSIISRQKDGYVKPNQEWEVGDVRTDLFDATMGIGRQQFFTEFIENADMIFSPENLNKIEAVYGKNFREALEDMLYRIKNGRSRPTSKNRLVNGFVEWINGAVGSTMFINVRSAVLQQLSMVNFLNFADNNIFKASAAFANQPQFWKDFAMIFNSDFLKQRRAGVAFDVNGAELAQEVSKSKQPFRAAIKYLLKKGFILTQIGDSNAIAMGGATFYRNRVNTYLKQGFSQKEAEAKAWTDFTEMAEMTQQSARPDMISQQQASPLGKFILAFQNVTSQYNRLMKKAGLDLINRRMTPPYKTQWQSDMSNISRIIYYGGIQNLIFYGLQTALFAMMFDDEERDKEFFEKKRDRIINGSIDSILRGMGVGGAIISVIKNAAVNFAKEQDKTWGKSFDVLTKSLLQLSPPIDIKSRKLSSFERTMGYKTNRELMKEMELFDINNPIWEATTNLVEGTTNAPANRMYRLTTNTQEALDARNQWWQRLALGLGWNKWELGVKNEEIEAHKEEIKKQRTYNKKKQKKVETQTIIDQEVKEEKKQEKEGKKKEFRCSGVKSNGKRCNIIVSKAGDKCTVHEKAEQRTDGKKSQCKKVKSNGKRCGMKTAAKSGYCYYHD